MCVIPSYKGKVVVVTVLLNRSTEHYTNLEYRESIRSRHVHIEWAPNHVVFTLADKSVIAYRTDNVVKFYSEYEND